MAKRFTAEDFEVGTVIEYGPYEMTREEIIDFATKYDPADFHLDDEAGKSSLLGGLSASGFHTCAATMRMICDAYILHSASQGSPGARKIEWNAPVRPGDVLHGKSTVLSARESASRPGLVITELKHETFNQNGEIVLTMLNTGMMMKEGTPE